MSGDASEKPVRVRELHGCLPLFFILVAVPVGCVLWLVPVEKSSRLRPAGEGRVYYHTSGLVNYEAARKSPLVLPPHSVFEDIFYQDSRKLYQSIGRDAELRKAPAMEILPTVADSVVISRDVLLELPPPAPRAPEQVGASQDEPAVEQEVLP